MQLSPINGQDESSLTTPTTWTPLEFSTPWTSAWATTRYVYFPPSSGETSKATHHTRITNYHTHFQAIQRVCTHPRTQKRIGQKLLDGYVLVQTGYLNDSHSTHSFNVFITANQLTNPLYLAFTLYPLYHTRDAN
jgi:hypothetical protein